MHGLSLSLEYLQTNYSALVLLKAGGNPFTTITKYETRSNLTSCITLIRVQHWEWIASTPDAEGTMVWLKQTPDHWFQEDQVSDIWTAPGLENSFHTNETVKTTLVFSGATWVLHLKPFETPCLCELNVLFFQPEIKGDVIKRLHSTVSGTILVVGSSCFAQFEVFPKLNTPALTHYGLSN